jgi:hypothetical protein
MKLAHRAYSHRSATACLAAACLAGNLLTVVSRAAAEFTPRAVFTPQDASGLENLAAQEVRRYLYARTGKLLPFVKVSAALPANTAGILVARSDRPILAAVARDSQLSDALRTLSPEDYLLKTVSVQKQEVAVLAGGGGVGTLYAAYRLAEHLGVRFYLHGDVIPDGRIPLRLPTLDERAQPLFAVRGIQPFHDFPEGPDWWNLDDYRAVLSQLPKLRMNFFALHTYPEGRPHAEPSVWIGRPGDFDAQGRVTFSYPCSYANTIREQAVPGNWGYATKRTSDFTWGAADLFEHDAFGPDVLLGHCPQPQTPEACNEVFNRTAAMLRDAFRHARRLGIKTCVGTETPLIVPKLVEQRLNARGQSSTNLATLQTLYEGIFQRAAQAYGPDYYWFWTPEGWTWEGTKSEQIRATTNDLAAALAAHRKVQPPFRLATCGWVLGPAQDRALFDKVLPKDVAVSCINREVGKTPVDKAFAEVRGRGKWAIPWLEDDPALTAPQLWVGRMRRDAADALEYACDGLLGIHWRTRVLGPAVSALAQAAWQQSPWLEGLRQKRALPQGGGALGGKPAHFPNHPIADTEEDPVYQSVRYDVSGYRLPVPNGRHLVTLRFCEPNYQASGKRVFDVRLQGRLVITNLDIFAQVGRNRALDFTLADTSVTNGVLEIDFVPRVEFPSIAGISVEGPNCRTNINCGGPAYNHFAADLPTVPSPQEQFAPVDDFYLDWATAHFGPEVGRDAAAIFARIDGHLHRPSDWVHGPGGIRPDAQPWDQVAGEYRFLDELAALRPRVKGAGQTERFDWWLNTFRYMRAMAQVNGTWAQYTNAWAKVQAEPDTARRTQWARETALPLRRRLVAQVGEVYRHLLATVSNPGELGTVANWDQHLLPDVLTKPGQELAGVLGEDLPADAQPARQYSGPLQVIVPTVRTSLDAGEEFRLKVIVLAPSAPKDATLFSRPLGRGAFVKTPLARVARGVYTVVVPLPGEAEAGLEYYVKVTPAQGQPAFFPASAPALGQTVVIASREH